MPEFGAISKAKLATCHPRIKIILAVAIELYDFSVLEGYRDKDRQNYLFSIERSYKKFPYSKHNIKNVDDKEESHAVDVAPYPINWKDEAKFRQLAYFLKGVAWGLGYKLYGGGDWDNDNDLNDQNFYDLGHFELRL